MPRTGPEARRLLVPASGAAAGTLAPALMAAASIRSSPSAVTRRYRFRPGLVEMTLRSSARLVLVSLSLPEIISSS
jgi:hypothetical protein